MLRSHMGKPSISFAGLPAGSGLAKLKSGRFSPCVLGISCVSLAGGSSRSRPNLGRVSRPAAQQWQAGVQASFRSVRKAVLARPRSCPSLGPVCGSSQGRDREALTALPTEGDRQHASTASKLDLLSKMGQFSPADANAVLPRDAGAACMRPRTQMLAIAES